MNNKLNNNFSLRKLLLTALVAGPLATLPAPLWALPDISQTNLNKSANVTTTITGNILQVDAPDKAVLTWGAFGSGSSPINVGETINYSLPSVTSSVLNAVNGNVTTTISGSITSNGNVYLLNPAGIIFTPTATVSVGGFYASTVPEQPGLFSLNGSLTLTGTPTNNITVQGTGITSTSGGNAGNVATIQAIGPGNNIYLAANAVDVQGGKFFGNLFVRSSGVTANLLPGGYNTSLGTTGPVSINLEGAPLVGGGLNIVSNGGNVFLSGGTLATATATAGATVTAITPTNTGGLYQSVPTVTITGGLAGTGSTANAQATAILNASGQITGYTITNAGLGYTSAPTVTVTPPLVVTIAPSVGSTTGAVTVNTSSPTVNGNITQGGGQFTASTTGTVVTLNANNGLTTPGNITLTAVDFLTVGANGNNILLVDNANDITLNAVSAAGTLSVTTGNNIFQGTGVHTVAGNITLTTVAGKTVNFTGTGNLTFASISNTSTIAITTSGDITTPALTTTSVLNLVSTGGQITTGTLSTSTLTITANSSAGRLTAQNLRSSTGTISVTGDIAFTNTTGVSLGNGNTLTVTSSSGNISANAVSSASSLSLTATAGSITTGTITTSSTLSLSAPSTSGTITTGVITSSTTRTVTLGSGGGISLAAMTVPVLAVNSTAGSITQTGVITSTSSATFNAAGDITLMGVGNSTNSFNQLVLQGGASGTGFNVQAVGTVVTIGNASTSTLVVGNTTNTKVPTFITSLPATPVGNNTMVNNVLIGNAAIDVVNFGSTLNLRSAGTINTIANTFTVFGNVTITTTGNASATLGNNVFGNAANYSFGQINADVGTGTFTASENLTLNLGTINAGNLDARSLAGDIVNTGALRVSGNSTFAANTQYSPGNISLTNSTNALVGPVFIGNANNFALVNTVSTLVTAGTPSVAGKGATGITSVTVTGPTTNTLTMNTTIGGVQTGGDFNIVSFTAPGAVTVTDSNALTLQNLSNTTSNGGAAVTINAGGALTLGSGINLGGTGLTSFTAGGSIQDSAPNIRIFGSASFVSDSFIKITNTGHSLGAVSLRTTGNDGSEYSISYVEGGTANLNVVSLNSSGNTGTNTFGNLSISSTGGDIIQTPTTGSISVPALTPSLTGVPITSSFTSATGRVALTNPAGTNSINGPITLAAAGNSSISTPTNVLLGNVTVSGGTFAIDTSNAFGKTILQTTGSSIKAYGNSSFITMAGKIALNNTGNNFGGLTFSDNLANGATPVTGNVGAVTLTADKVTNVAAGTTAGVGYANGAPLSVTPAPAGGTNAVVTANVGPGGVITGYTVVNAGSGYTSTPTVSLPVSPTFAGADVSVTEGGTLNLLAVNTGTGGNLTATSEGASIIQTGTGVIAVGGSTTLTANAAGGNIALNNAGNLFNSTANSLGGGSGIKIVTGGNASITDSSTVTALAGGTTIGGSLTLKNTLGTGTIKDTFGNITVSGNVLFDATPVATSTINITSSTASFGAVQFRGGTVTIIEAQTLNLAPNSFAQGPATLSSSGGDIITSGSGISNYQNTLTLGAFGKITIAPASLIFVQGSAGVGLTFRALGAVDLSALSLSANLFNIAPNPLSSSSYKAPSP